MAFHAVIIAPSVLEHQNTVSRNLAFRSKKNRTSNNINRNKYYQKQLLNSNGFTLIELMVTVAVIAILAAVVVPRLLEARNRALISTMVNRGLAYAKECTLITASGIGKRPATGSIDALRGGVTITEGCLSKTQDNGATLEVTWGSARAESVSCLNTRSTLTSRKALITVTTKAEISCTFMS
ncbi:MAG: prepilin-type N-terminal cleavage/methylation domain-containing protein [Cyanobacteria bacterium]|nr:prepilin-type N-terminal cleavage/methylation domain-containing protein [Cyanobacteriota bacterium]